MAIYCRESFLSDQLRVLIEFLYSFRLVKEIEWGTKYGEYFYRVLIELLYELRLM